MTLERIKEVVNTVEGKLNRYATYDIPEMVDCRYGVQTISVTVRIEEPIFYKDMIGIVAARILHVGEMLQGYLAILMALGYGKYNLDKGIMYLTDEALKKVDDVLDSKGLRSTLISLVYELKCRIILIPLMTSYEQLTEKMKKELGANFEKKGVEVEHLLHKEDVQLESRDNDKVIPWEWLR